MSEKKNQVSPTTEPPVYIKFDGQALRGCWESSRVTVIKARAAFIEAF